MSEWILTPQSSNVAGCSYDESTCVLTVEFKHGGRYDYYDVLRHTFEGMKSADSKGTYLHTEVIDKYRYARQ
ncbi:MAG: KTSC domain-containing protein [Endozoicomonas sp.]|uniref:KTSC domain-containing protein n=1 Tax=Endozoicomonas sp. TaxID=1892382 RepID=UPI003D9B9C8A